MAGEINTINRFAVGVRGDEVVIMAFGRRLGYDEAMNLAAWLVATAEVIALSADEFSGETNFDAWLNAVRAT